MNTSPGLPTAMVEVFDNWFEQNVRRVQLQGELSTAKEDLRRVAADLEELKHKFSENESICVHKKSKVKEAEDQVNQINQKLRSCLTQRDQLAVQLDLSTLLQQKHFPATNSATADTTISSLNDTQLSQDQHQTKTNQLEKQIEVLRSDNSKLRERIDEVFVEQQKPLNDLIARQKELAESMQTDNIPQSIDITTQVHNVLRDLGLLGIIQEVQQQQQKSLTEYKNASTTRAELNNLSAGVEDLSSRLNKFLDSGQGLAFRFTSLERQLEVTNSDVKNLANSVGRISQEVSNCGSSIQKLQIVSKNNDHSIRALDTRYNSLTTEYFYERIAAVINPFEPKMAQLSKEVNDIQTELSQMQMQLREKQTNISQGNNQDFEKLALLESKFTALTNQMANVSTEQGRVKGVLVEQSKIPETLDNIRYTFGLLKTSFETHKSEMRVSVAVQEENKDNIQGLHQHLKALKDSLKQSSSELLEKINDMSVSTTDIENSKKELDAQQKQIQTMTEQMEALKHQTQTFNTNMQAIEKSMAQRITNMKNDLEAGLVSKSKQADVTSNSKRAAQPDVESQTSRRSMSISTNSSAVRSHGAQKAQVSIDINRPPTKKDKTKAANPNLEHDHDTIVVAAENPVINPSQERPVKSVQRRSPLADYLKNWTGPIKSKAKSKSVAVEAPVADTITIDSDSESDYGETRKKTGANRNSKRKASDENVVKSSSSKQKRQKVLKR